MENPLFFDDENIPLVIQNDEDIMMIIIHQILVEQMRQHNQLYSKNKK